MTIEVFRPDKDETLNRTLTVWLCRVASLPLFALGLLCWVRLVGFYDGPLWRFDLMPPSWRVAASALAVLYPVAGAGLWMTASWGPVLWLAVAGVEGVMHVGFPSVFGDGRLVLAGHLLGLALLSALRIVARIEARRRLARR